MSVQMLPQQQASLWRGISGLHKLVQSQLLLAACSQQHQQQLWPSGIAGSSCHQGQLSCNHIHTSAATAAGDLNITSSTLGSSSSTERRQRKAAQRQQQQYQKRLQAYKSRLPRARKYGPALRDQDPAAFEQMRLVVGYYDLPQNLHKPRPPPPTHVTLNNLQTLCHTHAVDPYYKLALLSYRSKLQNTELLQGLGKARKFLAQLSAPPDFVPTHLEELTAAALKQRQQQQQQQQQGQEAADAAAESGSGKSSDSSSADSSSSSSSRSNSAA